MDRFSSDLVNEIVSSIILPVWTRQLELFEDLSMPSLSMEDDRSLTLDEAASISEAAVGDVKHVLDEYAYRIFYREMDRHKQDVLFLFVQLFAWIEGISSRTSSRRPRFPDVSDSKWSFISFTWTDDFMKNNSQVWGNKRYGSFKRLAECMKGRKNIDWDRLGMELLEQMTNHINRIMT